MEEAVCPRCGAPVHITVGQTVYSTYRVRRRWHRNEDGNVYYEHDEEEYDTDYGEQTFTEVSCHQGHAIDADVLTGSDDPEWMDGTWSHDVDEAFEA